MNPFDETRRAVAEAKSTLEATDQAAKDMADLLSGRLRMVSKKFGGRETLRKLKRELQGFNSRTGKWEGEA